MAIHDTQPRENWWSLIIGLVVAGLMIGHLVYSEAKLDATPVLAIETAVSDAVTDQDAREITVRIANVGRYAYSGGFDVVAYTEDGHRGDSATVAPVVIPPGKTLTTSLRMPVASKGKVIATPITLATGMSWRAGRAP